MKANLNLGRISGIKIQVHWTFFFLIVWIVMENLYRNASNQAILFNIAFVLIIFGCVVLHELGHALTARHYGIQTKKITLLPIGGVASLEKIPEVPKQELLVAIAGPLVNLGIAIVLYFIVPIKSFLSQDISELVLTLNEFTLQNFLLYLFVVNIALFIFNLIPAFPMDGGRVLRALIAMQTDRVKATQIAANIGQFIAVLFFLIGLLYNPFLIFIALFIFLGAYSENLYVQHIAVLKGHTVKESMLTDITTFRPENTIEDVINVLLTGSETNFVVVKNDSVEGILHREDIIKNSKNRSLLVKDIMSKDQKALDINSSLVDAYKLIQKEKKPFIAVTDNNKVVGAIDFSNLNEFIMLESKLQY